VDSERIPPDTNGAVGPDHIVEMINGRYSVYRKADGMRLDTRPLTQFWNDLGVAARNIAYNPRVLYDPHAERWFATAAENPGEPNTLLIAASVSSNPLDGWLAMAVDAGTSRCYAGFPSLGLDAESILVFAQILSITGTLPACPYNVLIVVPKQELLAAGPLGSGSLTSAMSTGQADEPWKKQPLERSRREADRGAPTAVRVARSFVNLAGSYQAVVDLDLVGATRTILHNGFPGAGTMTDIFRSDVVDILERPEPDPYDHPQLGREERIPVSRSDARDHASQPLPKADVEILGGNRFHSSMIKRNGSFWLVHTVLDFSVGIRPTLHWYRIDAETTELQEEGLIVMDGMDLYYGSIAVNELGHVVIGFNGSSDTEYIGSYAVLGQTVNDVTTFGEPQLLQASQAGYEVTRNNDRNRWGQYSATVVDPDDPRIFWTFQEVVAEEDVWSTQITQLTVFEDEDGDGVPDQDDLCPGSDTHPTVVIDGCDTYVQNPVDPGGCTLGDRVNQCAASAANHGGFVSCVTELAGGHREAFGAIRGRGAMVRCAARADHSRSDR
jgi:hypothetical protein